MQSIQISIFTDTYLNFVKHNAFIGKNRLPVGLQTEGLHYFAGTSKTKTALVLTAWGNHVLIIVPRNRSPDDNPLFIHARQQTRRRHWDQLTPASFVPRNMSTTPVLQIPMEASSHLNSRSSFNPTQNVIKKEKPPPFSQYIKHLMLMKAVFGSRCIRYLWAVIAWAAIGIAYPKAASFPAAVLLHSRKPSSPS